MSSSGPSPLPRPDVRPALPPPVVRAAELAIEKKARDVVVLDLTGLSSATDHFVLATGSSDIQIRAIAEHVEEELKKGGVRPSHVEGRGGGQWVLLDYIDFVVHVFHSTSRGYYQLETLWGDAPVTEFGDDGAADG